MTDYSKYLVLVIALVALIIAILGITGLTKIPTDVNETKKADCTFPEYVCTFGVTIGIPEGWLRSDTIIWYFIIPIMGVWMIVYGFLDRIRIFRASISGILALFIAFSMIPLGIFVLIVSLLFSIMGVYSVAIFVGLFFVGTYLYSKGLISAWRGVYGGYEKTISAQDKLIARLEGDVAKLTNEMQMAKDGTGKYHGVAADQRNQILQNTIGPRLLDAQKRLEATKSKKKFLQDQEKRVKKTFDLEAKT